MSSSAGRNPSAAPTSPSCVPPGERSESCALSREERERVGRRLPRLPTAAPVKRLLLAPSRLRPARRSVGRGCRRRACLSRADAQSSCSASSSWSAPCSPSQPVLATPESTAEGPERLDVVVGPKALAGLSFSSTSDGVEWRLDGKPIEPARQGGETVFRPARLAEGAHELVIREAGARSFASAEALVPVRRRHDGAEADARRPCRREQGEAAAAARQAGAGVPLVSGAAAVAVASDGTFDLRMGSPPAGAVVLTATDKAGTPHAGACRSPSSRVAERAGPSRARERRRLGRTRRSGRACSN